ncbi:hypothetical protein FOMPIDRAFT_1056674 [Fomitopsis schrenkii]|uniref:Uncharacterized protein n=1 Tax=Fomitopsis schrenkii TaxID=2126942 RepID=S8ES97_FOMSC|nr:hypothetical protein FOMPIDRAFT_1056674 [Fomitopsis schrenkii]
MTLFVVVPSLTSPFSREYRKFLKSGNHASETFSKTSLQPKLRPTNAFNVLVAEQPQQRAASHRLLPFHWVEVSNGRCLEKRDLSELGLILYLGHQGLPCPAYTYKSAAVKRSTARYLNYSAWWDLHFLTSKKSAYDFFEALHRLTDNSGTRTVKNRYRELNIAGRLWQHLTAVK